MVKKFNYINVSIYLINYEKRNCVSCFNLNTYNYNLDPQLDFSWINTIMSLKKMTEYATKLVLSAVPLSWQRLTCKLSRAGTAL